MTSGFSAGFGGAFGGQNLVSALNEGNRDRILLEISSMSTVELADFMTQLWKERQGYETSDDGSERTA